VIGSVLQGLGASTTELVTGAIAAAAIYLAVILATRVSGLRSFSKMSAFDFAMTVAIGSLIATAAAGQAPLGAVVVGVAVLFAGQFIVAVLRSHRWLRGALDNSPLLLMDGDRILHDNLAHARVTLDDLHGKLREAGVLRYEQVRAVVFETTGDVSVLHGDGPLDERLLGGVRDGAR
jgi:uncharacterized membrane protein YcaP (DUF421 family)